MVPLFPSRVLLCCGLYPTNFLKFCQSNCGMWVVTVFSSQEECEPYMREAFRTAKTIKILTIRGEKYFLGSRSLFYKLYLLKQKQAKNFTIQVLVLLPEAEHITEKLAEELGQYSAEEIRDKMHNVLKILRQGSKRGHF